MSCKKEIVCCNTDAPEPTIVARGTQVSGISMPEYNLKRINATLFSLEIRFPMPVPATSSFYSGSTTKSLLLSGGSSAILGTTGLTPGTVYALSLEKTDAIREFATVSVSPSDAIISTNSGTAVRAGTSGNYLVRMTIGPIATDAGGIVLQLVRRRGGFSGNASTQMSEMALSVNGINLSSMNKPTTTATTTTSAADANTIALLNLITGNGGASASGSLGAPEVIYSAAVPITDGVASGTSPYIALGGYVTQHTIATINAGDLLYLQLANVNSSGTAAPTILALSALAGCVVASLTVIRVGN